MSMTFKSTLTAVALFTAMATSAHANVLVNGGFEDGNTNGWTTGTGARDSVDNTAMTTAQFLPGGALYTGPGSRSSIIGAGTVDPLLGAALGSTVYSGKYSFRAEDTSYGGYASVISQKVQNYTDNNIFFAWKAVLQNGGHEETGSAEMLIALTDDTTGQLLIKRIYNAGDGGGGVDSRFKTAGDLFYTSDWQIEQLAIDSSLKGHDFTLSLLAADCFYTAHTGYVYLDGFGGKIPDPAPVPEPASAALMLLGAGALLKARRRKQVK